jgi:molybdopterin-binding protein
MLQTEPGQPEAMILDARPRTDMIMKIGARNRQKGKIVDLKTGATTAHVRIDVNRTLVTASITNDAVDELGLKVGKEAFVIVKASDVMVGIAE